MATRTLHPSQFEIQREVEALRDIRRRSITPGALAIDPDLPPNQSPPSSPTTSYWSSSPPDAGTSTSPSSNEDGSLTRRRSARSTKNDSDPPTDDPFHLFWVPASLHPEIAPAEFRAFLKEHARTVPPSDESSLATRSNSISPYSPSLVRRKSMLSRQYQPSENDGVEDENIVPLKRNQSNRGAQLTINDLQKLEELAEMASNTDDPSKFRNILRRSLSLNLSPTALWKMEETPDMPDEADAPIIVPPLGNSLRRAARTKIRKPGLPGDGEGHRFGPYRRAQAKAHSKHKEPRTSSDRSSSDHGESVESATGTSEQVSTTNKAIQRESYSEIYEAYARDPEEEEVLHITAVTSPESPTVELPESLQAPVISTEPPQLPLPQVPPTLLDVLEPVLQQPESQHEPEPEPEVEEEIIEVIEEHPRSPSPSSSPSPPESTSPPLPAEVFPIQAQPPTSVIPISLPTQQRKDKDKKGGLFSIWGGDKGSRKSQKNVEKETGFFGSLFGSKKKHEHDPSIMSAAGREAAQALLGASKSSKNHVAPMSSGLPLGVSPNNYSRYPIHVERAIYRLSHIKLANPRRPLYEQVLISNLMFWYLGVINKAQTPGTQANGQSVAGSGVGAGSQANTGTNMTNDADQQQRQQQEREERERAERERLEKERMEREQRERAEREMEQKKKESGRRGSLTKTPNGGALGGGRRAEMPIKGPQYEMQHRVMEQEYGNYSAQAQQGMPLARTHSAPVGTTNSQSGQQFSRGQQSMATPPKLAQPQPLKPQMVNHIYYSSDQRSTNPTDRSNWLTSPSPPPQKNSSPSPPSAGVRSQSPPVQNSNQQQTSSKRPYSPSSSQENLVLGANNKHPGRSLSATAVPSPPLYQVNGRARKGTSAHAALSANTKRPHSSDENGFEEEDVPLAIWQQQRRR